MTILGDLLSTIFERRYRTAAPDRRDNRPMEDLVSALVGTAGDVTGLAAASTLLQRFQEMEDSDKLQFFRHLAHDMNIDPAGVRTALDAYEASPNRKTYTAFMAAVEPKRQELIRRLNQIPGATEQLVRMRADLLRLGGADPELQALDQDFRHLFISWFNRGFLVLRPISWESPAHILEKIIAYEAVHEITSWEDLRSRLAPGDRRCFAFFHPSMPDEPLIFVEVALTADIPGSIQDLLAGDREPITAATARTAVFYSISNCQEGLARISFGNSLIKQVAADLSAELPGLKTFVTLSPIPGLTKWLSAEGIAFQDADPKLLRTLAAHYLLSARRGNRRLFGHQVSGHGRKETGFARSGSCTTGLKAHGSGANRSSCCRCPACRAGAIRPPWRANCPDQNDSWNRAWRITGQSDSRRSSLTGGYRSRRFPDAAGKADSGCLGLVFGLKTVNLQVT